MTQSFKVELLHGLVEGGRRHTLAQLREPTGLDEAMFAELGRDIAPAERASALIAALTLRIGSCERPSMDMILQLTAGDRERILFATSARLLGPQFDLVTSCSNCRNLIEIPVRFEDIIEWSRPTRTPDRITLETRDGSWIVRCRPPTGADLEKAVRGGPDAARMLIVTCVVELIDPAGDQVAPGALPAECEDRVAAALAELDPAAECRVHVECPFCAMPVDALVSGYVILQGSLGDMRRVYDDVFRMAHAYHWSQSEILSLPLRRRRHYLAVAEAAGAGP